ncbi:MAG TPA: amidase family protein [Terriglobales bacterium]|nr:amidase family protein [Terriglobales bacterium]
MSGLLSDRRAFLSFLSTFGVTSTLFPGVLWAAAEGKKEVTKEMIANAAALAGIEIADEHKDLMVKGLNEQLANFEAIRKLQLANSVEPSLLFDPVLPGMKFATVKRPMRLSPATAGAVPKNLEEVAFWSARQLAALVRARRVSSMALTEMYLERLKRYDPLLKFVVTLTEDRAQAQAREADRDLARGRWRGPLHGLPWGAKDLLAVKGYPTTWGANGFEKQTFDEDAEVVKRLDAAGAVLVAKLTLGALALGDVWFGGMTRNPWKPEQGSSGSSAGSASATAAGCVAFAIGSETLGSISSPSTRCGTTGLRPTFGRVPRTGAMALVWSMDKLGPICRAVEDCAMVFDAIRGPDGRDRTVRDLPFNWDAALDPRTLRVGYFRSQFDRKPPKDREEKPEDKERREEAMRLDMAALEVFTRLGIKLLEVELPGLPYDAMLTMLESECAAAFDELTRSGRDKLLVGQKENDWPNIFRVARFIPAVEYVNASRARTLGQQAMAKVFEKVDVVVAPTTGPQLIATNLTGHPAVILPNGFRTDETPTSLTFLGNLYGEAAMLAVARAYQEATEWHLQRPKLDEALEKTRAETKS